MEDDWGNIAIESVSSVISDAIVGLDYEGQIAFWNEGARELFGYADNTARDAVLAELFELNELDEDQIRSLLEDGNQEGAEPKTHDSISIAATTASGTTVPVELTVADADSHALLCVAHPTEEAITVQDYPKAIDESVYRRAIEESTDLIAAADRNERLLFANKRYREFHELAEPVSGQSLSEILPLETYTKLKPKFDQVLDGHTLQFEMERLGPDGTKHSLDVHYYPLRSASGEIHSAVTTMREITELKQRAESLRKSWETYRDIVDGIPHPLVVHTTDGEIIEVNEAASRFIGYQEETLLGKHLADILVRDRTDKFQTRTQSVASDEEIYETRCQTKDGEEIPIEVAATRIEYFGTEAILSVARDLTEYKAYERTLEETNARLEEFAAVVSEDLRNPLTVARGWIEMAQEQTALESLDRVEESLDRIDQVIDYTLTLARKGEGLGTLSEIELSELLSQCWHSVETNGATLETEVDLTIRGDLGRVGHLFETVFENCATIGDSAVRITVGELDYRDGFYIAHDGPEVPPVGHGVPNRSAHIGAGDTVDCDIMIVKRIAQAHGWRFRLTAPETGGVAFEFSNVDIVSSN